MIVIHNNRYLTNNNYFKSKYKKVVFQKGRVKNKEVSFFPFRYNYYILENTNVSTNT